MRRAKGCRTNTEGADRVTLVADSIARHFTNQFSELPGSRDRRHICLGDDADAAPAGVNDGDTSDLVLLHDRHHLRNRGVSPYGDDEV